MTATWTPRPAVRIQLCIKHFVDKLAALLLFIIALPIGLVVAALILLEDGSPVFFVQQRLGKDGKVFPMLKFRSMRKNCPVVRNDDGSTRVELGDTRITRIGSFLRRSSLDEMPQILNVLAGDMSLIGPRPDLPEHLALYTGDDRQKLRFRPGITGLPQVSGRNDLAWKDRIRLDNQYIDTYSLKLDLSIAIRTVLVVATGRGVVGRG